MMEQESTYAPNEGDGFSRRGFLRGASGAFGAAGLAGPLAFMETKNLTADDDDSDGRRRRRHAKCGLLVKSPYGPIAPVKDQVTGLPLIQLPKGFTYKTFSWTGDTMSDGNTVASGHDGMAVVKSAFSWKWIRRSRCRTSKLYMIRNHETFGVGNTPIASDFNYDSQGGGGTTVLTWQDGSWVSDKVSLSGTVANCAGGRTPWSTWISCEEGTDNGDQPHGYPFESTIERVTDPQPIKAMGRFKHEAIAVDPHTGLVYQTEDNSSSDGSDATRDRGQSLFYRFIPRKRRGGKGTLLKGGKLQALVAVDKRGTPVDDLRNPVCGASYRVKWVDVDDPDTPPGANGASGPYLQARPKGATRFQRLEGCWWNTARKEVVFNDTEGGPGLLRDDRGEGAVWSYDPRSGKLKCLFVSALPDPSSPAGPNNVPSADNPDNITVSPKGDIFLCEDGGRDVDGLGLSLLGLTDRGQTFEFARNNIVLTKDEVSNAGKNVDAILGGDDSRDFTGQEWAGATFSPDGKWLFVNIQTPGITFAITGPWKRRRRDDD